LRPEKAPVLRDTARDRVSASLPPGSRCGLFFAEGHVMVP